MLDPITDILSNNLLALSYKVKHLMKDTVQKFCKKILLIFLQKIAKQF